MKEPLTKGILITRPYVRLAICFLLLPISLIAMLGGMSIYLPLNQADKIILPILLFPLLYTGGIFLLFLTVRPWRVTALLLAITAINLILIFNHFSRSAA